MNLKTKAKLTIKDGERINHPSGNLSDEVTTDQLKKNPDQLIRVFPSAYDNRKELEHEIATRVENEGMVKQGSKNILEKKAGPGGIEYHILRGKAKKKSLKSAKAEQPKEVKPSTDPGTEENNEEVAVNEEINSAKEEGQVIS